MYLLEIYTVLYLFTRFLTQIDLRFSEKNQDLFNIFQIFDYNNYFNAECLQLQNCLNHYKYFKINVLKIPSEFTSAKSLLQQNNIIQPDLNSIIDTLKKLPLTSSIFRNIEDTSNYKHSSSEYCIK